MVVAVLLITPLLLLLPTLAAYALMLFVLWAPFVMLGQVSRREEVLLTRELWFRVRPTVIRCPARGLLSHAVVAV